MLKLGAYAKSPVHTFVMLHPRRALKWGVGYLIVKTAMDMKKKRVNLPA
jgi:hypothetical protein